MKVKVTLTEIRDRGDWSAFCEKRGYDVYCINEGTCSGEEEVELSPKEISDFHLKSYVKSKLEL